MTASKRTQAYRSYGRPGPTVTMGDGLALGSCYICGEQDKRVVRKDRNTNVCLSCLTWKTRARKAKKYGGRL